MTEKIFRPTSVIILITRNSQYAADNNKDGKKNCGTNPDFDTALATLGSAQGPWAVTQPFASITRAHDRFCHRGQTPVETAPEQTPEPRCTARRLVRGQ
jgi:hypothetical protein